MPIALEPSGFYEWYAPLNPVPALGIDSARLDEVVAYYFDKPFFGLFGHKSFGFDQTDLNFLSRVSNARYLWLWDITLDNIDGLYELKDLAYVGINPKRPGIDFSKFPALRTIVNDWIKADSGISSSTIADYYLWHYKPRSKSFVGIEIPSHAERLEFNWANPTALTGLPRLEKLKRLEIHYCRNLCDLSVLPEIAPNLESLSVSSSKRVDTSTGVLNHPSLRNAYVNGKVIVDHRG